MGESSRCGPTARPRKSPTRRADGSTRWRCAEERCAWSAGKQVSARDEAGAVKTWSAPSTARGLAFQPKGYRLAATHYNGATLWFPKVEGAPQTLEWKGAHLDATFSPDGRFLVTSMQENVLHGWRLSDSRHMRMTGYPGKTRSLSWSHDGAWLATSGADAAVVWPFKDKDGPMGKAPRECGVREARATKVAFHPKALVVAIGYADGAVLLCRLADAAEIPVRHPGDGPISALSWDATGARLLFGLESGAAGLLTCRPDPSNRDVRPLRSRRDCRTGRVSARRSGRLANSSLEASAAPCQGGRNGRIFVGWANLRPKVNPTGHGRGLYRG